MNPLIQLEKTAAVFFVGLVFACFALPQRVQATDLGSVLPGGNTAAGFGVLTSLTTGGYNTGTGWFSLKTVSSGSFNTAFGAATLFASTGDQNTAFGAAALFSNTTGTFNTANGSGALLFNTTGFQNTATGAQALFSNTTGNHNTANGLDALLSNTTGNENTANGYGALAFNTAGLQNTAVGFQALVINTTGDGNTAIGLGALQANTTGGGNIALGFDAGSNVTTANSVICIGADGNNVDNSCYIGQIFGATSSGGAAVFVNSNGRLGTMTSSRRFKEEIRPMDKASETLFALKPVAFRYKKKIDPARTSQFGLVAEEVEKVNPDLIVRDNEGKAYSVRYDQVNAMLLNEFLKEHKTVQEQGATITQQRKDFEAALAQQQKEIEALTATLKEQASQIQKVSAQIEMSKFAPQVVFNNQ
jgi:Chaperone of endosialidase